VGGGPAQDIDASRGAGVPPQVIGGGGPCVLGEHKGVVHVEQNGTDALGQGGHRLSSRRWGTTAVGARSWSYVGISTVSECSDRNDGRAPSSPSPWPPPGLWPWSSSPPLLTGLAGLPCQWAKPRRHRTRLALLLLRWPIAARP